MLLVGQIPRDDKALISKMSNVISKYNSGRDQCELERVERVGGEDLCEEAGVDHGRLRPVRPHQVHRLGLLLPPLGRVVAHRLIRRVHMNTCTAYVLYARLKG
jgi:hypothetical protein